MKILITLFIGYIIGSIPAALVIGKVFYNKDVRQYGSGNLGGSNTGRVLGKKAGLAVMALDVLKAIISISIVYFLYHDPLFFIIPIGVAMIVLYLTKIVSISSSICSLAVSLYIFIKLGFTPTFITTLILSLLLIYRHRSNLIRIKNENKIKWM